MHGPRTFIQLSGQGNGGANGLTVINLGGEPGVHQINATDFSSASFVNAKLRCGKIRKFPSLPKICSRTLIGCFASAFYSKGTKQQPISDLSVR